MAKKTLVTEMKSLVETYREQNHLFSLVMMIPTEPTALDSKYTVLVSAPWLDDLLLKDAIDRILYDLIEQLGSTESPLYRKLSRIAVRHSNDPFVQEITSVLEVDIDTGELMIQNCTIHGVHVERAIILESRELLVYA
ncbi:MAG: hypothetical protein AAF639_02740 [Chloroflexota bacterium]